MERFTKLLFIWFLMFVGCGEDQIDNPTPWNIGESSDYHILDMSMDTADNSEDDITPDMPDLPEEVVLAREGEYQSISTLLGETDRIVLELEGSDQCFLKGIEFKAEFMSMEFYNAVESINISNLNIPQSFEKKGNVVQLLFHKQIRANGTFQILVKKSLYGKGMMGIPFLSLLYIATPILSQGCKLESPVYYDMYGYIVSASFSKRLKIANIKSGINIIGDMDMFVHKTQNIGKNNGLPLGVILRNICFNISGSENILYKSLILEMDSKEVAKINLNTTNAPTGDICFDEIVPPVVYYGEIPNVTLKADMSITNSSETYFKVKIISYKYISSDMEDLGSGGALTNPEDRVLAECNQGC